MRLSHFEALRPICPVCNSRGFTEQFPLRISSVSSEVEAQIIEGILLCTNPVCQSEFPILDGVPIILPNLRSYVAANIFHLLARHDLSANTESILGDCCSQGSVLDSMKQHLSCYVWGHYADLDPNEPQDLIQAGSVLQILEQGVALEARLAQSTSTPSTTANLNAAQVPTLDIGCGPGRTTIHIAEQTDELTLGIDLNFSILRLASSILRDRRVTYPRRRTGLVYDRREFDVAFPRLDLVDFWACDALALPFSDGLFGRVIGMNVLDSVASPSALLGSIAKTLKPSGSALLACPYDWTASVTPVEEWFGGHSQRNENRGDCSAVLRKLLNVSSEAQLAQSAPTLQLIGELDGLPWTVRLHDRSSMLYHVHLVHARCRSPHSNAALSDS